MRIDSDTLRDKFNVSVVLLLLLRKNVLLFIWEELYFYLYGIEDFRLDMMVSFSQETPHAGHQAYGSLISRHMVSSPSAWTLIPHTWTADKLIFLHRKELWMYTHSHPRTFFSFYTFTDIVTLRSHIGCILFLYYFIFSG